MYNCELCCSAAQVHFNLQIWRSLVHANREAMHTVGNHIALFLHQEQGFVHCLSAGAHHWLAVPGHTASRALNVSTSEDAPVGAGRRAAACLGSILHNITIEVNSCDLRKPTRYQDMGMQL